MPRLHLQMLLMAPALLATSAQVHAKDHGPEVVAHLTSDGVLAQQMTLKSVNGWEYLYVEQGTDGSTIVIDVSHANRPKVLGHPANVDQDQRALSSNISVVNPSDRPHSELTVAKYAKPASMRFMNQSDPAHPKPIPELDGATSMTVDRVRGLLFVSNAAGLWIVRDESLIDPSVKIWNQITSAP